MPPKLALLLCSIFVIWLLRLDRKQSPNVSPALWIPTLWILLISSKPLGVWFPTSGADAGSGSVLDQIIGGVLICIGMLLLARRSFNISILMKQHPWLFVLVGYTFISIFWSDIMFLAFKRWIREVLAAITMACLMLTERNPRQAMISLMRRSVYILIPFSVLLIKYFPEFGVEYARWSGSQMWIGVTLQKNGLGRLSMISSFYLIWTLVRRWQGFDKPVFKYQNKVDFIVLLLCLHLLTGGLFTGTFSATAISAFAIGLILFIGLVWMRKNRRYLHSKILTAILLFIIAYGILTLFTGGSTVSGVTSSLGREGNLTGRTEVWADLLPVAMQQPIMGHGYAGFWTPAIRQKYNISEAHSGYLEILLELGFCGLILYTIMLINCCHKMQMDFSDDFYWASLSICYVIMGLVHNISESSYNSFASQLTAISLFLMALSSTKKLETYNFKDNISH